MTCSPQHDHAFKQCCARAAHALEEIHVGASNEVWSVVRQIDAVFHRRVLEEAHLAPDIVDRGDEEVKRAVHGVELRVWHDGEAELADERANKLDVCAGVVAVLVHPLVERGVGERAAACVREEGLVRCQSEDVMIRAEQVVCEGRHLGWRRAHWSCGHGLDECSIATSLVLIWSTAVDLEVRIGLRSVENALRGGTVHVGAFGQVGGCVGGVEVGLTLL